MKTKPALSFLALMVTLSIGEQALAAQDEAARPSYIVYDTDTLGGTFAFGAGVNDLGWVSGASSNVAGSVHATLAAPGAVIDLGTLGGTNSAVEWPVKNNHGLIVGISESAAPDPNGETFSCDPAFIATNGHTCLPFLWQNGSISALPLLGGNNGFATGVNNLGQAVGWAETAVHDPTCVPPQVLQFEAVLWGPDTNQKRVLPPFAGDSTSAATAINDAGEVVGISGSCDVAVGAFSARHALLWLNGEPIRLPTLGGRGWNTPMAINNAGTIVGFSDTGADVSGGILTANFQAALWTPAGITNLHTLPGDSTAEATGVNDFDQIVGTSFDAAGSPRVFLWEGGRMYDLNTLVQANAPLYLLESGDINDRGEITGLACVVAEEGCGATAVLHTFVAILAPGAGAAQHAEAAVHVSMPAQVTQRLRQARLFGHGTPERMPAQ